MTTSLIPFADPPWINGLPSPYYTESHRKWQRACRACIEEHLLTNALEWDTATELPPHVFQTFAKHHMFLPALPPPLPVDWLQKLGIRELPGGLKVEDFDYMHMAIYTDEVSDHWSM